MQHSRPPMASVDRLAPVEAPDPAGEWACAMPIAETAPPRRCPHCGSDRLYGWGRSKAGVPRGRCRECARSFSSRTGSVAWGVRHKAKFRAVVAAKFAAPPASCRELGRRFGLDKMTVWHWRRKVATALLDPGQPALSTSIDLCGRPFRESRKASREWVRHGQDARRFQLPNRPRWVDVDHRGMKLLLPLAADLFRVVVGLDEAGYRAQMEPVHGEPGELSVPSFDGRPPCPQWRAVGRPSHAATDSTRPEAVAALAPSKTAAAQTAERLCARLGMPDAAALDAALKRFLRPFRGPAACHFRAYVAWFVATLDCVEPGGSRQSWRSSSQH